MRARAVRRDQERLMPLSVHRRRLAAGARLVAAAHTGTTAGTQLLELRLEGDLGHLVVSRGNAAELRKAIEAFEAFADADDDRPDTQFTRVERLVF
jgi:hypothetical protein